MKDQKIKVGIVRGGSLKHYASSLEKGGHIISHIFENLSDKYKVVDILIDKNGVWHLNGIPIDPQNLVHKIDVIWDISHSSFSNIIENFSIPNISNSPFLRTLENNSDMLRRHIKDIGLNMPRSIISPKNAREVFEKFAAPWIVKINNEIKLVKTFDELTETLKNEDDTVVEEFISGKVASIHSVPFFRNQDFYTFPIGNSFGSFTTSEKEKLSVLAKDLHYHIGANHYLKSDFVLNPRGKVYLLSIESIPDFHKDSHLSQVSESVGVKAHHIIDHIIGKALNKRI